MLAQQHIDTARRRILPHTPSMQQTINISSTDMTPRENHRNYVFVDEHNRHKRLKVMRACEGCRRRKIKCDAATTNTWPCSACVRLKLHCVPPTVQYDRDFAPQIVLEREPKRNEYHDNSSGSGEEEYSHHPPNMKTRKSSRATIPGPSFIHRPTEFRQISPSNILSQNGNVDIQYSHLPQQTSAGDSLEQTIPPLQQYHTVPNYTHANLRSAEQWDNNDYNTSNVSSVLEQLKIEDSGIATYISAQGRRLAEAPAYEPWSEEYEVNPSFAPVSQEFAVRILPSDMPSDMEALKLFNIFFKDVHPYLPIINKAAFYGQWNTARESISPLLLETIFACAARMSDEPSNGLKWIAMASKHMDCFMDVPRLNTVQALLLLLKARESAPQRGYFFRSWMSVVSIIAMAKDLGLDKHYDLHKNGTGCGESAFECQTRTRVWQACFVFELMISAPQGRDIMQISPDSVDLTILVSTQDVDYVDEHEASVYRNFVFFVYLIKNIRRMNDIHAKLKSNSSWRNDPEFTDCGHILDKWAYELPPSLHANVPTDLSIRCPPLPTHFVGNLQIYHHLARIMIHRPPLAITKKFTMQGQWKEHMTICSNSAKIIYRLTEKVWEQFGIPGLQCMMRGINFTIYANLTATMIHLIAATCPDPDFNADAKEYFTRSMRILETCVDISASAETKGQIQALREAFSLDINRPFELNPNFPFYHPIPAPADTHLTRQSVTGFSQPESTNSLVQAQVAFPTHPLSPPPSTGECESKGDSPTSVQPLVMLHTGQQVTQPAAGSPIIDTAGLGWNPARIFESWNTAIAGMNGTVSTAPQGILPGAFQGQTVMVNPGGHHRTSEGRSSSSSYAPANINAVAHAFVSPGMWHDAVAAVYADTRRPITFGAADPVWTTGPEDTTSQVILTPISVGNQGRGH